MSARILVHEPGDHVFTLAAGLLRVFEVTHSGGLRELTDAEKKDEAVHAAGHRLEDAMAEGIKRHARR